MCLSRSKPSPNGTCRHNSHEVCSTCALEPCLTQVLAAVWLQQISSKRRCHCNPSAPTTTPMAPDPELEQVRRRLMAFGAVSSTYDKGTQSKLEGLLLTIQDFLQVRRNHFIQSDAEVPVMYFYSSDPTPLRLGLRLAAPQSIGQSKPMRHDKSLTELLLQVVFHKLSGTGKLESRFYVRDPLPLSVGKKSWNLLQAALSFCPHLKNLGHLGISIAVSTFDRGIMSSMGDLLQCAEAEMLYQKSAQPPSLEDELREALTWQVTLPCSLHDTHNALKWAMFGAQASPEVCKRLHIVVESLRNSFDILHGELPRFVRDHLHFCKSWDAPTHNTWRTLWAWLGVSAGTRSELERLQLRWDEEAQVLCVAQELENSEELTDLITSAMLSVFRFAVFTLSRWLSVGASCKNLVAAALLGLFDPCRQALANPDNSRYYLGGVENMDMDLKCALCPCSHGVLAARCSCLVAPQGRQGGPAERRPGSFLNTEQEALARLDLSVWQQLTHWSGYDRGALALRSVCLPVDSCSTVSCRSWSSHSGAW